MRKVLLFIWSVCLFLEVVASGNNLEINIFNVGWGNFVLLKRNNNVLVIDCGKANAFKKPQDRTRLVDILSGSENCRVIITHDHKDHSAARVLWNCLPEVSKRNAKFFYGWFPSNEEREHGVGRRGVRWVPLCNNPKALDGCLGDGVSIYCIIPERENIDRHVNNLVIGIKYGNKSFIFPGDANQNWFSENSEQLQTLISKLEGVDFLLIPHHGSMSDTGFFMKNAIEHFTGDSAPTSYPPLP